ncbi:MAG: FliM/FliN family flagellar motor switch protein [Thermoguttaceae bacterium]|nr:FliM/FliN family flagellar motor switch protein [Thermoguttaceae bacterium]MDW8038223.1 FliM/FliN family flagellar motor switch protein [Thermoguttaceae bacterium]
MSRLTPDLVVDILALCQAAASEIAAALGRGLDTSLQVSVTRAGTLDLTSLPEGFDGPGLVVVLKVGAEGALFLLPESCGFLPPWYAQPDPTGQSKLTTLAQELGMLVIPESLPVEDFRAGRVGNLREAILRSGLAEGAPSVLLAISGAKTAQGTAVLSWPASRPDQALTESKPSAPQVSAQPSTSSFSPLSIGSQKSLSPSSPTVSLRDLPPYSKSLLRIKIPVAVTLARKKHPLGKILDLGAGSIIHFDKSCEEPLELEAAGYPIALGEAVKVGEKFGLRILRICLPEERILPVKPRPR